MVKKIHKRIFSKEHRENLSKAMTGKPRPDMMGDKCIMKRPGVLKKILETRKNIDYWTKIEMGILFSENNLMKNPKIRKKHLIACRKKEHRETLSKALKGKEFSKEHRKNLSKAGKGRKVPWCTGDKHYMRGPKGEKYRKWMSENSPSKYPEFREKSRQRMIKNNPMKRPEVAKKVSIAKKKLWRNKKWAKKMIKSWKIRPTILELKVAELLNTIVPNQYKYNGNKGNIIVGGRCPDFVNCNGEKKVILVNGIYWHLWKIRKNRNNPNLTKKDIEIEEKKPYEEFGFKVLFLWENEIKKRREVVQKIKEFTSYGRTEEDLRRHYVS